MPKSTRTKLKGTSVGPTQKNISRGWMGSDLLPVTPSSGHEQPASPPWPVLGPPRAPVRNQSGKGFSFCPFLFLVLRVLLNKKKKNTVDVMVNYLGLEKREREKK